MMKATNPESTRLTQKQGLNIVTPEASVPKVTTKRIVRISRERALPLPLALTEQSREVSFNSLRGFGINE